LHGLQLPTCRDLHIVLLRCVIVARLERGPPHGATAMRRREFIKLVGGAAAWPAVVRAQQLRPRRVAVLMGFSESDVPWQDRLAAFRAALAQLGWTQNRNLQIDVRWAVGDRERQRAYAAELIRLAPDVIFASPASAVRVMHQQTRAIPIVAVQSGDLARAGLVQSHARPGGNVTGFMLFETTINTKYLQLIKEVAPNLNRVAVMQTPSSAWRGDFRTIEKTAPSLKVKPVQILVRDTADVTREIAAFAGEPNGGLIFPPDASSTRHRELLVKLAIQYRLPTVFAAREFVISGGLIYYGSDHSDIFKRAAGYVHRILRGEKPAGLAVQSPTKYELVINLKTAKLLGLHVPLSLLVTANDVIE
jgi:ABC-type uncharacterized transport system substrate-binding protein